MTVQVSMTWIEPRRSSFAFAISRDFDFAVSSGVLSRSGPGSDSKRGSPSWRFDFLAAPDQSTSSSGLQALSKAGSRASQRIKRNGLFIGMKNSMDMFIAACVNTRAH